MHELGKGMPVDYATALQWYMKAAENDNESGMHEVGLLHYNGKGVPMNKAYAYSWILKSCKKNNMDACDFLKKERDDIIYWLRYDGNKLLKYMEDEDSLTKETMVFKEKSVVLEYHSEGMTGLNRSSQEISSADFSFAQRIFLNFEANTIEVQFSKNCVKISSVKELDKLTITFKDGTSRANMEVYRDKLQTFFQVYGAQFNM